MSRAGGIPGVHAGEDVKTTISRSKTSSVSQGSIRHDPTELSES